MNSDHIHTPITIKNLTSLGGKSVDLRLIDGEIVSTYPDHPPSHPDHPPSHPDQAQDTHKDIHDNIHDNIIDAKGALLFPPIFDSHVHLSEPGAEARESLAETTALAARGGITHLLGLPYTYPASDRPSMLHATRSRLENTIGATVLPTASLFTESGEMAELALLKKAGAIAVSEAELSDKDLAPLLRAYTYANELDLPIIASAGLKTFGAPGMSAGTMATLMGISGQHLGAEAFHIEMHLRLAEMTGARIHFPLVTTIDGIELIRRGKDDGVNVTAGTAIAYATVSEISIGDYRTFAKLIPPLRSDEHRLSIIQALKDGTLDCLCSNHRPVDPDSKRVPFEMAEHGSIGLESLLSVSMTLEAQGIHRKRILELLSPNPAKIMGIDLGSSRSFTVYDPKKSWIVDAKTAAGRCRNVIYENLPLSGKAVLTVVNGEIIFNDL